MITIELEKDQIASLVWLLEDPSLANVMKLPQWGGLREALATFKEALTP